MWSWFDSSCGVCWFHLIRELWSGGGLLIVPWFWRFGDVIVIHWLTNEVSGGGVVLGESWGEWRSDWGRWLFIWCESWNLGWRVAVRGGVCGSRYRLVILLSQVDSQHWLKFVMVGRSWFFDFGWWGVWLVVIVNDEWWFVDLRSMIRCFGCGLRVTWCSCSLFCVTQVNCRVVWGLDHKAGAGRVVGYWFFDGFGWRLAWIMFFWRSGWFVDELLLDFRLVVERGSGVGRDFILAWLLLCLGLCEPLWRMASKDMLGLGLCLGECSGPWTLVGLVVILWWWG